MYLFIVYLYTYVLEALFNVFIYYLMYLFIVYFSTQVLEAYRNIAASRQKKKTPSKKDKDIAWKAIKDREGVVRQLDLASNNNC